MRFLLPYGMAGLSFGAALFWLLAQVWSDWRESDLSLRFDAWRLRRQLRKHR